MRRLQGQGKAPAFPCPLARFTPSGEPIVPKASSEASHPVIADAFRALHTQQRSAWTLELDLRPYKEAF